jgi:RNA polymerase sigma factor (sigma-70 family)
MKKMLILPKGERKEVTFEEILNKYKPLLNKQAYLWYQYDRQDIYQTASIGLWKAYENYDIERGYAFSTMAKRYVINEVLRFHYQNKPKYENKTSQIKGMTSLQSLVFDKHGEGTELMDLVGIEETFTNDIVEQVILRRIFRQFSERQRYDIINYIDGYSKGELIEAKQTTTKNQAKRIVGRTFTKFRNLYIKEMCL